MQRNAISLNLFHRNFTVAIIPVIALSLVILSLSGCGADGQGGPVISSLSTPTETPSLDPSVDGAPSNSNPAETESPAEEDVIATSTDDTAVSSDEEFDLAAGAVDPAEIDPAEMEKAAISMTGATARVTWDASSDPNVQGYFIHYGKQSSGQHGSCSYEESQRVGAPPAIITGLEPNTPYFFAISAFGESESESETPCSNEIIVVTSAAQS